ncbi:TVP38/TMEM64 family protein [Natrinema salsiterrestre]|uniref:VTT domain-containing protein n=1 Tax=Natrinema salsiterrestre TaxID=2950540 RepID=A0A9Q4KWM2_9EURY|nr:VTT domain-containing protein [Natrinema salsiterrestre]MDF9744250.1 VTT domain-containing protein [Natrinema salsiterrestre]
MSVSTARMRVIAGAIVATGMVVAGVLVSPSTAIGTVDSLAADPLLFGVVVAGLYLVRPFLAWPTTPLAVVVGYGFGVAVGVPVALAGIVVTVLPVFVAARLLSADDGEGDPDARVAAGTCESDDGTGFLERARDTVGRYYETAGPLRGVTASRLAPIPSDVATCAAAISGVSLRQFVLGTVIGELPWTIAAVVVGASAATITAGGFGELGLVFSVGCAVAAAFLLAGPIYRTMWTKNGPQTESTTRSTDS